MNIYLLTQDTNNGYDTYDAVIVAAGTEEEAKLIHPSKYASKDWAATGDKDENYGSWTSKANVKCQLIGVCSNNRASGIILASFNAG